MIVITSEHRPWNPICLRASRKFMYFLITLSQISLTAQKVPIVAF